MNQYFFVLLLGGEDHNATRASLYFRSTRNSTFATVFPKVQS